MKKQKMKLGFKKSSVSSLNNLDAIKGGDPTYSEVLFCIASFNAGTDVCCESNECTGTTGVLCGNTIGSFCGYHTYEVFGCK